MDDNWVGVSVGVDRAANTILFNDMSANATFSFFINPLHCTWNAEKLPYHFRRTAARIDRDRKGQIIPSDWLIFQSNAGGKLTEITVTCSLFSFG